MADMMDLLARAHRAAHLLMGAAVQNDPKQVAAACEAAEDFIAKLTDHDVITEMTVYANMTSTQRAGMSNGLAMPPTSRPTNLPIVEPLNRNKKRSKKRFETSGAGSN